MTIVQNPLITYMAWLVERDLGWADSIASNFFETWQILDETKKLLDVPKEEYDAKNREIIDYLDARRRGEEGMVPTMLDWDEGDYDYGDDDEHIPGIRLKRLIVYLNKFIELNRERYVVKIALQLFQHTDYMLFSYTLGNSPINLVEYQRGKYIDNLLKGDLEAALKDKNELQLLQEEKAALRATKASWDDFIKSDFNRQVISDYERASY